MENRAIGLVISSFSYSGLTTSIGGGMDVECGSFFNGVINKAHHQKLWMTYVQTYAIYIG
ncbi:hypothetical protein [Lysinibacillus sp. CTST325]